MSGTYRTIVADPPWPYGRKWGGFKAESIQGGKNHAADVALPYREMTLAQITALPVVALAADTADLYLWTTNRFLPDAFVVVRAWGFRYGQTLVWAKTPMGKGPGGKFAQNAEYIILARRGKADTRRISDTVWFNWKRTSVHSRKPEAFFDLVEQASPGPRVELFARRHRLGWDVWGNEVTSTVELALGAD